MMMLTFFLLACSGNGIDSGDTDTPAIQNTTPTDTFPSFYGSVPKNILMISVDTYRRDHMERYGGDGETTPFMDTIAAQGLALDDHRACSNWTYPSVVCTMNGMYNIEMGVIPQFNRDPVPDRPTLAKRLDGAGFHSILITSNGWLVDDTNADYGYTYSDHPAPNLATTIYEIGRDKLLEDISAGGVQRWMLHLHFKEPHVPYEPPGSYLEGLDSLSPVDIDFGDDDEHYDVIGDWNSFSKDYRDLILQHMKVRYKAEMRYMDDLMLDIWSDLQSRGLLEDTLVVFWSDHGEQFFEHGNQTHAYSLYGEENDAIGFFWAKNIIPVAWDGPTSNIDIVPTLLDLYGLDVPADMSGVVVGSAPDDRPIHSLAVARIGTVQSIVMGDYKLHYQWNNGEKLLFNLAEDPAETENLYDSKDPTVIALWDEMMPRVEALDALITASPIDPGP